MKNTSHQKYDLIGIWNSLICLVHCIAVPIFFKFQSSIVEELGSEVHLLDYFFLIISTIAVYFSAKTTHSTKIKVYLWLSLACLAIGVLFAEMNHLFEFVIYTGSVAIILSHIINLAQKKQENHICKTA